MTQRKSNQVIRIELAMPTAALWSRLCDRVNDNIVGTPPELSGWLEQLRIESEALLDLIDKKKKKAREDGAVKHEIDMLIASVNASAKPNRKTRAQFREALGEYRLRSVASLNEKSGKLTVSQEHAKSASNKKLVLFALCVAISSGDWRNYRRCKDPTCSKLFYDTPSGRPRKRYCKPAHGYAHRQRIRRGGSNI